jgi:hypothetical protein
MRLLVEIILAAALIALVWEKSLRERATEIPVNSQHPRSKIRTIVTPVPTVSGPWMWDPNRKSALDRPSPTIPPRQEP